MYTIDQFYSTPVARFLVAFISDGLTRLPLPQLAAQVDMKKVE